MVRKTIRLIPGGIVSGPLRPMRLLWIPADESDREETADGFFQIRVRIGDGACETHQRNNDMTVASCAAQPAP